MPDRQSVIFSIDFNHFFVVGWQKMLYLSQEPKIQLTQKNMEYSSFEGPSRENVERLNIILECTNDGLWDVNLADNKAYYSPQIKAMLGYDDNDTFFDQPNAWQEIVHPKDFDRIWQMIHQIPVDGNEIYNAEFRLRCKDGSYKWVLTRGKVVKRAPDGSPLHMIGIHTDISSIKFLAESLAEREEHLRLITENITDIVSLQDLQANILYVTPSITALTGYGINEYMLISPRHWVHPDDLENIALPAFRSVRAGGNEKTITYRIYRKDGEMIWVESKIRPILNSLGELAYIQASTRDITARKKAENLFETVFNISPVLMGVMTIDTFEIVDVNKTALEFLGYSRNQIIGRPLSDFLLGGSINFVDDLNRMVVQNESIHNLEVKLPRLDGTVTHGLMSADIIDIYGAPHVLISFVDISELAEVKRGLEESQKDLITFKKIFESAPLAMAICEPSGRMLYINPAHEKLFGYILPDPNTSDFRKLYSPEIIAQFDQEALQTITKTGNWSGNLETVTPDGRRIPLWAQVSIVLNENGEPEYSLGFSLDDSQRVQAEEQLLIAKEQAEKANQAKSDFLAMVSHEIRTPMNAILGFTRLLDENIDDPKLKSFLEPIKASGETLITLINDILDLSRIEAGKLAVQTRPVLLRNVFADIEQMFSLRAAEKELNFFTSIDPSTPGELELDEIRLRQVLFNLVGNAIRYTDKGHVILSVRALNPTSQQVDLEIIIEDSGSGIPADELEHIFEVFGTLAGRERRKLGSTGLGLAISKRMVDLMGGSITVKSNDMVGTVFTVHFPGVKIPPSAQIEKDDFDGASIRKPVGQNQARPGGENGYLVNQPVSGGLKSNFNFAQEICRDLENQFMPQWNKFQKLQPINELRNFAENLRDYGIKTELPQLVVYAGNLLSSVNQFDVEEIDRLLTLFPELVFPKGQI